MKLATILSTAAASILYTFAAQAGESLRSCNPDEHASFWTAYRAATDANSDAEAADAARQQMDAIKSECSIFSASALQGQLRERNY